MKRHLLNLLLAIPLLSHASLVIEPPAMPPPEVQQEPDQTFLEGATPGRGVIALTNADRISGRISHLDLDENLLVIQHESVREPIAIDRNALEAFEAERMPSLNLPAANWIVHLSNGDALRGNVRAIDEDTLQLDTWYGGMLSLDRTLVAGFQQQQMANTLYAGPYTDEGWQTQGNPQFLGDSIAMGNTSPAAFGRELPRYTPKFRIDIDAHWMWQANFSLRVLAEQALDQSHSSSAYLISFSGNRITLMRIQGGRGSRSFGNANLTVSPDNNQRFTLFMSLFVDAETGRFLLYQDNRPVGEWTDSQPLDIQGRHFSIMSQHSQQLTFNAIRVTEWDGRLPTDPVVRTGKEQQHTFRMQNGDILSGRLTTIQDDLAMVETTFGALQIPIERIDETRFDDQSGAATKHPSDVRIHLIDDSSVTLEVTSFSDNRIVGRSDNLGRITLPLAGVRIIEWHIPEKDPEDTPPASTTTPPQGPFHFRGLR